MAQDRGRGRPVRTLERHLRRALGDAGEPCEALRDAPQLPPAVAGGGAVDPDGDDVRAHAGTDASGHRDQELPVAHGAARGVVDPRRADRRPAAERQGAPVVGPGGGRQVLGGHEEGRQVHPADERPGLGRVGGHGGAPMVGVGQVGGRPQRARGVGGHGGVPRGDGRRRGGRRSPGAGRGSGSPRLGHSDIARSASAVIVSDGFTPRFAGTVEPSTTWTPGWPCRRWYGSTTPVAGRLGDHRAAEEVPGDRHVDQRRARADGEAADPAGDAPGDVVARRDPRGVRRAGARAGGEAPEQAPRPQRQRVVERLHHQQHDRLLRPAPRAVQGAQGPARAQRLARDPAPRRAARAERAVVRRRRAVDEHRREQRQQVRPAPVAHRLDVGVRVGVDRRGDRDPAGEVDVVARGARGEDGLGVGAGELAEPRGDARQVAPAPHAGAAAAGCRAPTPRRRPGRPRSVRRPPGRPVCRTSTS